MGKIVIWSKSADIQTQEIHAYILEDTKSFNIADKVVDRLFNSSDILEKQPKLYPLDRFKTDNDGTYRAYEIYRYRISYRILKDNIRILRVRHTSREPLEY